MNEKRQSCLKSPFGVQFFDDQHITGEKRHKRNVMLSLHFMVGRNIPFAVADRDGQRVFRIRFPRLSGRELSAAAVYIGGIGRKEQVAAIGSNIKFKFVQISVGHIVTI